MGFASEAGELKRSNTYKNLDSNLIWLAGQNAEERRLVARLRRR
jgi:hypothetical protein